MTIVVLGGGAIGSVAAAKLSAQHAVTLVARPAHVEAIRARGLELTGAQPGVFHLSATTSPSLAPGSLVLLATKVNDSHAAVAPIVAALDSSHTIVCLQNGLYAEDIVRGLVDHRTPVLRAI